MTLALPRQGLWRGGAARGAAATVAVLAALAVVVRVHPAGQTLLAATLLLITALALWTYTSARTQALGYLFPGVAAALVFVAFPMLYTVGIGFTNYSSSNLLEQDSARAYLLEETIAAPGSARAFSLHADGERFRVQLQAVPGQPALTSAALALNVATPARQEVRLHEGATALGPALPLRAVVDHLEALRAFTLRSASGQALNLVSLREFAQAQPLYVAGEGGALTDQITRITFRPDATEGYFTSADGQRLTPGYRVAVGARHYVQLFSESKFREPFVSVFLWTGVLAALSVFFAAALGLLLAVLLNWEPLQGKGAYRLVLFLPYAVPGFISILIFKGLFNQNLGEINLILHGLFGIRPAWFSDPLLAKVMLLTVNVWLGFPYMMVLCAGLIKSIPADLYEASAVVGAGPLTNFWRITLPLILKPLTPLLISAFAFNFNNFVLISLLTNGRPDQLDATLPAGTTDILVSYTWRIAFQDSGQQFGLAAAISTVIFLIVAAITLVQMRFTRIATDDAKTSMAIVQPKSQRWRLLAAHAFLLALCALVVFPFIVVLSVSLRPGNFASGSLIPQTISLEHWRYVLGLPYAGPDGQMLLPDLPVLRWLWNSVKVAALSGVVTLLLSTTASYALARLKFRGRRQLLTGLMLMQMFPAVLALIALYAIFDRLGTALPAIGLNTHWSLVLAYSGGIAMHVWTLKGYYDTLPGEIEEAARVDGATPWQAFVRVLLPMAVPILMVVFMLAFIGAIIEYPVASVLLTQQDQLTLAVGSKLFVHEHNFHWGDFAAAAILSGLPITVVFLLAQRWMIAGLAAGGVKG